MFRRVLLLVLPFLGAPFPVFAHRLDEYLQATIVVIEPDTIRLRINLTPGVSVAEQVLAKIDRDRDGVISAKESAAYGELLKRDLVVGLDGGQVELQLVGLEFPEVVELRNGFGIIQMEFSFAATRMTRGAHKLTLENRHMNAVSVFLINAAKPKDEAVEITRQSRNENQSAGEIEFNSHDHAPSAAGQ